MFSLAKTASRIRSPCRGRPSSAIASTLSLQLRNSHNSTRAASCLSVQEASSPFSIYLSTRRYQSLAPQQVTTAPSTPQAPSPPPSSGKNDPENPTQAEQRRKDWRVIWRLMANVWPKNDWGTRGRVLFGLSLLVGGKVRH